MKSKKLLALSVFSSFQAYLSFLVMYDKFYIFGISEVISTLSIPVYIMLLPIVKVLNELLNWDIAEYRNWLLPHLELEAWIIGIPIFTSLNCLYLKLLTSLISRLKRKGV